MSKLLTKKARTRQEGFTLIEVIIAITVGAVVGVILISYMGVQLTHSIDPVNITREEGVTEMWMERIISDYVQEMNTPPTCTTALATIAARDYTAAPYNMPAGVTLTRTYVTYDGAGNEVAAGGPTRNLKLTVQTGGYNLTSILTAERTVCNAVGYSDPVTYY